MPGEFNWDKVIESHDGGVAPEAVDATEGTSRASGELENILNLIPDRNAKSADEIVAQIPPLVEPPALDLSADPNDAPDVLINELIVPVNETEIHAQLDDSGWPVAVQHEVEMPTMAPTPIPAPAPVVEDQIPEPAPAHEHFVSEPTPTFVEQQAVEEDSTLTFELPIPPPAMDEPDFVLPVPPSTLSDNPADAEESFELPKPPPARPDFLNHMANPYEASPDESNARKLSDERMANLPTPPKHVSAPPLSVPSGPLYNQSAPGGAPSQRTVNAIYSGKDEDRFDIFTEAQNEAFAESSYAAPLDGLHLDDVLRLAVERRASDIHFTAGLPPMARIDGEVQSLPYAISKPGDCRRLLMEVLNDDQIQKYEKTHELDLSYSVRDVGRFRVNMYMQRGTVAAAIRAIPGRIPSFDELCLPNMLREISQRSSGLILVTGPTGSGKSTSIAAMIDDINTNRNGHIMTIEDPIEYLHKHKKCMVNQREMHGDTYSFHNALRAVLREDPDIILVGELRDLETIEAALTLAETGHLVFGTLHTRNAPATIDRLVDVFPSDAQDQIRVLLGNTLEGVISQQLLPKIGGGRVAALEIMTGVPSVRNLIREGKTHQLYSVIETGKQHGMFTMDGSLASLFRSGIVSYEECMLRAVDKESFARLAKAAA